MRRVAIVVCLALLAGLGACGSGDNRAPGRADADAKEEAVVHFANFAEEIGPETLAQFTRETGIRVVYDVYETNTMLDAKLLAGGSGYDVVVPGNNFAQVQIAAGIYQPLDRARLPNWANLDPDILRRLESNDPGNRYTVPYLYGTHALGYDARQVEAALGKPAPDSWALLFDPAHASKLKDCGIVLPDTDWIMVAHALRYLGRDPNSHDSRDLADAMDALQRIRPYVRDITSAMRIEDYAEGQACLFAVPSADVRLARDLAAKADTDVDLRYIVPREGSMLWFDLLAIPADAPHPENAHRLIDFLLRPEVIARVTEATYFANANRGADELVPDELRNDPLVYPDATAMERLEVVDASPHDYARERSRAFTRFRNAQ